MKNKLYNFINGTKKINKYKGIRFNRLFIKVPFYTRKRIKKYKLCEKIKHLRILNLK